MTVSGLGIHLESLLILRPARPDHWPPRCAGLWWMDLLPAHVAKASAERYVPVPWVEAKLGELGFSEISHVDVFEPFMNSKLDCDINGPFSKAWRDGDSRWCARTLTHALSHLPALRSCVAPELMSIL